MKSIKFMISIHKTGHIMITIISVGSNKMFKNQEQEYLARIIRFRKAELIELKNNKSSSVAEVIRKEGELLLSKIKGRKYYALDPKGATPTTHGLKDLIVKRDDSIFIIGGAFGLSKEVKDHAEQTISLSRMTFTHEMARVLILEQIYRAITIERGMRYHK